MNRLLILLFFLLISVKGFVQPNHLFIKKGVKKKYVLSEGDRIHVRLKNGEEKTGLITRLRDQFIYINGKETAAEDIAALIKDGLKKSRLPDLKTMGLITAGVGLTTVGLSLNGANKTKTALIGAAVIGYGPILLKFFGGRMLYLLKRKEYRFGKKYRLQVFDITVPPKHSF